MQGPPGSCFSTRFQLWEDVRTVLWLDVEHEDEAVIVAVSLSLDISCSWQVHLQAQYSWPRGAWLNKESKPSFDLTVQDLTLTEHISEVNSYETEPAWGKRLRNRWHLCEEERTCTWVETEKVRWDCELDPQLLFLVSCLSPRAFSKPQPPFCGLERTECLQSNLEPGPMLWNVIWGVREAPCVPPQASSQYSFCIFSSSQMASDIWVDCNRHYTEIGLWEVNNCIHLHTVIATDCFQFQFRHFPLRHQCIETQVSTICCSFSITALARKCHPFWQLECIQ